MIKVVNGRMVECDCEQEREREREREREERERESVYIIVQECLEESM